MNKEVLEEKTTQEQTNDVKSTDLTKKQEIFTPSRFSVRGVRKHSGIKTSRNPSIVR